MFTAHDLDSLGKKLSQDYIENKVELTESLAKIATAKSLNKHQISRVAEAANVESYLTLMKTAEDKYINFPLADAQKAYELSQGLEKEANSVVSNDYYQPLVDTSVPEVFNKFASLEGIERSEDQETQKSESEWRKEASEKADTIKFLKDALYESNATFETTYSNLKYHVKQAMLQGTTFADIKNVICVASHPVGEPLSDLLQNDLKPDLKFHNFEKEAEYTTSPNPESKIFKSALKVAESIGRHKDIDYAIDKYMEKYEALTKEAGLFPLIKRDPITNTGKVLKSIINFPTNHPVLALSTPALVGTYYFGKSKGKKEQGAFLAQGYSKLGPTKNKQKIFR